MYTYTHIMYTHMHITYSVTNRKDTCYTAKNVRNQLRIIVMSASKRFVFATEYVWTESRAFTYGKQYVADIDYKLGTYIDSLFFGQLFGMALNSLFGSTLDEDATVNEEQPYKERSRSPIIPTPAGLALIIDKVESPTTSSCFQDKVL